MRGWSMLLKIPISEVGEAGGSPVPRYKTKNFVVLKHDI